MDVDRTSEAGARTQLSVVRMQSSMRHGNMKLITTLSFAYDMKVTNCIFQFVLLFVSITRAAASLNADDSTGKFGATTT